MSGVGIEVGFSSAGAGALGTAALLSLTSLTPAQVVGTDIVFGFFLSLVGSGAHGFFRGTSSNLLQHLIIGGLAGVDPRYRYLRLDSQASSSIRSLDLALDYRLAIYLYECLCCVPPESRSWTNRNADRAEGFGISH